LFWEYTAEKCAKAWIAFVIWSSTSPILSFPVNLFNFGSRSPQGRRGVAMKKRCGSERLLEEGEGTRHLRIEINIEIYKVFSSHQQHKGVSHELLKFQYRPGIVCVSFVEACVSNSFLKKSPRHRSPFPL
jgi:hypothetical protein